MTEAERRIVDAINRLTLVVTDLVNALPKPSPPKLEIGDEVKFQDLEVGTLQGINSDGSLVAFMLNGNVRYGDVSEVTKLS